MGVERVRAGSGESAEFVWIKWRYALPLKHYNAKKGADTVIHLTSSCRK